PPGLAEIVEASEGLHTAGVARIRGFLAPFESHLSILRDTTSLAVAKGDRRHRSGVTSVRRVLPPTEPQWLVLLGPNAPKIETRKSLRTRDIVLRLLDQLRYRLRRQALGQFGIELREAPLSAVSVVSRDQAGSKRLGLRAFQISHQPFRLA